MAPLRKRKRVENEQKQEKEKVLVSGPSQDRSAEWWEILSRKIAGNSASSSQGLNQRKSALKMSKRAFEYICSLVKEMLINEAHFTFTNGDIMSLNDVVAVALRRLSTADSLASIGNAFGTCHSTVSQLTWLFVKAIAKVGVDRVRWPSTEQELNSIKTKVENIQGFPNCCGAICTSRIAMKMKASDQDADHSIWVDSAGNHSMILQVIVDPDLKFRDIVSGWMGRFTDQLVLQESEFYKICQKGERVNGSRISLVESFELREYIVGNSSFPLLPWLITPYQRPRLPQKVQFNERLTATHLVARKALAKLKEDWKIIKGDVWTPDTHKLPTLILACCILHNIVIDMDDNKEIEEHEDHSGDKKQICRDTDDEGSTLRDMLAKYLFG